MTQKFAAPLILATRGLSHFLFNSITRFFNLKTKQKRRKEKKRKENKRKEKKRK